MRKFNYKLYMKNNSGDYPCPDFEVDVRAKDSNEAVKIIWNKNPKMWEESGWDKRELRKYLSKVWKNPGKS